MRLKQFEEDELKGPAPRKVLNDRTIYMTRRMPVTPTVPIMTDFGDARLISKAKPGEFIMPHHYRAPEVILSMEWNDKVDIWNVAVLVSDCLWAKIQTSLQARVVNTSQSWDLVSPGQLFRARILEERDSIDEAIRIADMVAVMGPPPKEYLERSEDCEAF